MSYKLLLLIIICGMLLITGLRIAEGKTISIPNPLGEKSIPDLIKAITGLLKTIAIPIGSIMIIVSGIQYLFSAGSEEKATKARKTMLYTVIGVAIIIAADFIVGFIKEILGPVGE